MLLFFLLVKNLFVSAYCFNNKKVHVCYTIQLLGCATYCRFYIYLLTYQKLMASAQDSGIPGLDLLLVIVGLLFLCLSRKSL